jgi:photosystem II stability/assembly factor-like uncharacterized protein
MTNLKIWADAEGTRIESASALPTLFSAPNNATSLCQLSARGGLLIGSVIDATKTLHAYVNDTHQLTTDLVSTTSLGSAPTTYRGSVDLIDEAEITLTPVTAGWGTLNVGDGDTVWFRWKKDGSVTLIAPVAATFSSTNQDGYFCIYQNGAGVRLRNRLGGPGTRTVRYELAFNTIINPGMAPFVSDTNTLLLWHMDEAALPAIDSGKYAGVVTAATAIMTFTGNQTDNYTERDPAAAGHVAWSSVASNSTGAKLVACAYNGRVYTSTDSGANWTARVLAGKTIAPWTSVASDSTGAKLVACDSDIVNGHVYTSTDSGANWTERDPALLGHSYWSSVDIDSDGTFMIACAVGGRVCTSTNSGGTWVARTLNGVTTADWASVSCDGTGTKLMAGARGDAVFSSINGGVTWSPEAAPGDYPAVSVNSDGTKMAYCLDGSAIYTSIDDGASWQPNNMPGGGGHTWASIDMDSDGSFMIAATIDSGAGRVYTTGDGGANWIARTLATKTTASWSAVACDTDGNATIAAITNLHVYTEPPTIYATLGNTAIHSGMYNMAATLAGTLTNMAVAFNAVAGKNSTAVAGATTITFTATTAGPAGNLLVSTHTVDALNIYSFGGTTFSGGFTGNSYVSAGTVTPNQTGVFTKSYLIDTTSSSVGTADMIYSDYTVDCLEGTMEFYYKPYAMTDLTSTTQKYWFRIAKVGINDQSNIWLGYKYSATPTAHNLLYCAHKGTSGLELIKDPFNPADYFATDRWTHVKVVWSKTTPNPGYVDGILRVYFDGAIVLQKQDNTAYGFIIPWDTGRTVMLGNYANGLATYGVRGYYTEMRYSNTPRL